MAERNSGRPGLVIKDTHISRIRKLPDADRLALFDALLTYWTDEQIPDSLPIAADIVFDYMRPGIDSDKEQTKDIYIILNHVSGKAYVGQAVDVERRFKQHISMGDSSLIGHAIRKYGAEAFSLEILEHDVPNYDEREHYWIAQLNTLAPNGYNVRP